MANQQAFQAYAQNKGTLVPGQSISVNKYTVQVERYLSQGGFAHVYLVRTATPVYNTTQHVLKRIAVANEAMLTEVKKEVDIMRLLKGHPNIVHLIDAAWHKMPDGLYEVFILMEFCAGGGIIDMMNRRLRERLTEAEILQIFVDVCEGVAYMHNSRPALLHRDLKVENILQSSSTSFKLCDFGSATTVLPRPPATTQEIRALEADLQRHTTLQYRAPEMVDPYLRRPVDEKSDVWALGVLLYKLCYYTTPFEEHGNLAILNVQYRIPPYPVYSPHMNSLIATMLRDQGSQRPSVFELLAHVHRLRGTRSQFQYNIPAPQTLSTRNQLQPRPSPSPNPLDDTISYRSAHEANFKPSSSSPPKNQGVQAREKVLEAIAPMRRGRPTTSRESGSASRPPSPSKRQGTPEKVKNWMDEGFVAEEGRAWKSAAVKGNAPSQAKSGLDDAWNVRDREKDREVRTTERLLQGFNDDFGEKLWDAFDPSSHGQSKSSSKSGTLSSNPIKSSVRVPAFTGNDAHRTRQPLPTRSKDKDAFEGLALGISPGEKPAPTLGEARKLRTGLAAMHAGTSANGIRRSDDDMASSSFSSRPTVSPRHSYLLQPQTQSQPKSLSPAPLKSSNSGPSWRVSPQPASRPSSSHPDNLAAEARFPSLEELDATFPSNSGTSDPRPDDSNGGIHTSTQPQLLSSKSPKLPPRSHIGLRSSGTGTTSMRPTTQPQAWYGHDGARSEQVTGIAMREARGGYSDGGNGSRADSTSAQMRTDKERDGGVGEVRGSRSRVNSSTSRPALTRKHRSSVSVKAPSHSTSAAEASSSTPSSGVNDQVQPPGPVHPLPVKQMPMDWLTGEDNNRYSSSTLTPAVNAPAEVPVLRESPSKRASFIEKSSVPIQEAITAFHGHTPASKSPPPPPPAKEIPEISPTVSRFTRVFPPIETAPIPQKEPLGSRFTRSFPPIETPAAQKELVGSLTDNWSPVAITQPPEKEQEKVKEVESASSADEGPEDANGYIASAAKTKIAKKPRRKGRQSSVHDLVDLWGGGLGPRVEERGKEPVRVVAVAVNLNDTGSQASTHPGKAAAHSITGSYSRSASPHPAVTSPSTDMETTAHHTTINRRHHEKQSISGAPSSSPVSARSRPQSMFIFPSKLTDGSSPASAGLYPPDDPQPRASVRRTSITDMVQRYEAIGGRPKASGLALGPPSPSHPLKPIGLKVATRHTENGRGSLSVPGDSVSDLPGDPSKSRTSPTRLSRATQDLPRSPVGQRDSEATKFEDLTPRPRRSSFRPEPLHFVLPSRKSTMSEESVRTGDGRSPSPERPYQGVGKLIDQWQRKAAEAPPRSSVGVRRGGLVAGRSGGADATDKGQ